MALRLVVAASMAAVSLFLGSCGGGGGGSGPADGPPPPPAPLPPVISDGPGWQLVSVGSTATFTVNASRAEGYQWQAWRGGAWTDVPGGTAPSLTVGPVTVEDDEGEYRVVVRNAGNPGVSVTSSVGWLNVRLASTSQGPGDLVLEAGQSGTLRVVDAVVPREYDWVVSPDRGTTWFAAPGAVGPGLQLDRVAASDSGWQYLASTSHVPATLTVRETTPPAASAPPSIARQPLDQAWPARSAWSNGNRVLLSVGASGSALNYQWQVSEGNGPFVDIAGANQSWYGVPRSYAPRGAAFRVRVRNGQGTVLSRVATVRPLDWHFVNARPTPESLFGTAWVDGTAAVAVGAGAAIHRTTDRGQTWVTVYPGDWGLHSLQAVAFDANRQGLAVGDHGLVLRSPDGGLGWVSADAGDAACGYQSVAFAAPGVAVAAGNCVARTTDGGLTWQRLPVSEPLSTGEVRRVSFGRGGLGLLTGAGVLLRSMDGGATWMPIPMPAGGVGTVAFAGDDSAVAISQGDRLTRTTDGGLSWTEVYRHTGLIVALSFRDALHGVAMDQNGHLLSTADGGASWTASASGLDETQMAYFDSQDFGFRALALNALGEGLVVGGGGRVGWTLDGGRSWTEELRVSERRPLLGVAFSGETGLAVGKAGRVLRSADGGRTWNAVGSRIGLTAVTFASATICIGLRDGGGIVRSNDGGLSWTAVGEPAVTVRDVAFATPQVGVVVGDKTLLRTVDAGATWRTVGGAAGLYLRSVAFGTANVGVAVGEGGAILRSTDAGATWTVVPHVTGYPLSKVVFADATTVVVVGTGGRTLRSTDGGLTWSKFDVRWALVGVAFSDALNGLAVGSGSIDGFRGNIYRTRDGGATWGALIDGRERSFEAVAFTASGAAIVVGGNGAVLRGRLED